MTDTKLMEKIIRAKIALEEGSPRHADRCRLEMDPDYYGPCTCGRQDMIAAINKALRILELS